MNNKWQIKSYVEEHNRVRDFKNRNVTYKWLAKIFFEQWKVEPTFPIRSLHQDVQEKHSYQHNNPSTDNRLFQRMYICLQACKEGFKAGYGPIICLNGCRFTNYYGGYLLAAIGVDGNDNLYPFCLVVVEAENESSWIWFLSLLIIDLDMKNSYNFTFMSDKLKNCYEGYLLAAVGVDGNDNIYPICWAVVEVENESSWMWFLSLLIIDLNMTNSYNFTFMSDKLKGLFKVLLEPFPHSQHRKCVRYLYSNFKNVACFKGKNLKDALRKAARSTYKKEFDDTMAELEKVSPDAFDWLKEKNHFQWSKSYFRTLCKFDMLLNNFSECFNEESHAHMLWHAWC
ncbi:hypothetical protein V6N13_018957 [Hibiscus sabdariffa]